MAKVLKMSAYISNASDHTNVVSLGDWLFGVCVDTGFSSTTGSPFPDDTNFWAGTVDDLIFFGGDMPIVGAEAQMVNLEKLRGYFPAVRGRLVDSQYVTSNYVLKLVNKAGDYAIASLLGGGQAANYTLYNSNGTQKTSRMFPLSGNANSASNNNVSWCGFVVSGFGDDGKFTTDAVYYAFRSNQNRYWDRSTLVIDDLDLFVDFLNNVEIYDTPSTDPYEDGGSSGAGGGSGNFDGTGDDVGVPSLPTLSAVETGFITLYNPSLSQLRTLASYMWGSNFDLDMFKKLFADPMDAIIGLSIVPVAVPNGGNQTLTIGNISTGITLTKAGTQYVEVDCGSLNVNEYWGAYLDYDPYTKAEIYLPYIGTHPIAVDDIMGKTVQVVYHVDILSGACTAFVKCGGSVLYTFIGQCSSSIPITGADWTNVINGVLSIAGAVGTMVATGGMAAPMAVSTIASTAVNGMKPSVEKSGSMSGTGGMMSIQTPYLILTRPRQALPHKQNEYTGYPSFITENLIELTGYTEIESIHLDGVPGTDVELAEIETLLKGGVIF